MLNTRSHVFISYAHANKTFVERLHYDLIAAGVPTWIDQTGLSPGTRNWEQAIRHALDKASALVLVATPQSLQSDAVHGEVAIAEGCGLPIYPLWAEGNQWHDCVPLRMIKTQFIDMRGTRYQNGLAELIGILASEGVIQVDKLPSQLHYLERIFDIAPMGIIVADREGLIIRVNRAALSMMGYELGELVGQHVKEVYTDPQTAHDIGDRLRASEMGELFDYETRIHSKQHPEGIPIRLAASWLYNAAGVGIGSVGLFVDLRPARRV